MQISSNQIAQVNQQIQALLNANNFYGKKLKEAGVSSIQSAEDFENLPFSEKNDLRNAYPLGLMTAPKEKLFESTLLPEQPGFRSLFHIQQKMWMTGQSCSSAATKWQA